jgi:hypothetical protein
MILGRFLLFLFAATVAAPAVVMVDFLLERDRIIKELCVQRAVPEMERTCHGQCHLAKQLKETAPTKGELPVPPTIRFEVQFAGAYTAATVDAPRTDLRPSHPVDRTYAVLSGYPTCPEGVPWG